MSVHTRGSHRYVSCTSICDGGQSEIEGSSTQTSSNQGIEIPFRRQTRSKSKQNTRFHIHNFNEYRGIPQNDWPINSLVHSLKCQLALR